MTSHLWLDVDNEMIDLWGFSRNVRGGKARRVNRVTRDKPDIWDQEEGNILLQRFSSMIV